MDYCLLRFELSKRLHYVKEFNCVHFGGKSVEKHLLERQVLIAPLKFTWKIEDNTFTTFPKMPPD